MSRPVVWLLATECQVVGTAKAKSLKEKFTYKEQQRDQNEWRRERKLKKKKNTNIFLFYPSASSCSSHKVLDKNGNMGILTLFFTSVELFLAFSS